MKSYRPNPFWASSRLPFQLMPTILSLVDLPTVMNYAALLFIFTLLSAGVYFTTMIHCWRTGQYDKVSNILLLMHTATIFNMFLIV